MIHVVAAAKRRRSYSVNPVRKRSISICQETMCMYMSMTIPMKGLTGRDIIIMITAMVIVTTGCAR